MSSERYHWCAVPECKSNSIKTPKKLFIYVPYKEDIRKEWLQLANLDEVSISPKSTIHFCEDHFNLPQDMKNFMEYHIMGSVKQIIMKPGCKPSKFESQSTRKRERKSTNSPQSTETKKQRLVSSSSIQEECARATTPNEVLQPIADPLHIDEEPSCSKEKNIQVFLKPRYRSRAVQVKTDMKDKITSALKPTIISSSTSPFTFKHSTGQLSKSGNVNAAKNFLFMYEEKSESELSSYTPQKGQNSSSLECSTENEEKLKIEEEKFSQLSLENTMRKIKKKTRMYIGIPKECYFLINIIKKQTRIKEEHILMCLRKIRLDTTFAELADDFGISLSYASKIFLKNIPILSDAMQSFIVKLDSKAIKKNLPIAFRHKYHKVSCIIDCLEIEIQKPSKSIHQALTWSEYKKANTVKYLISSTPDGVINYISPGYGGRISDVLLVESCNFLDQLEPGACILADRGFKHIEQVLLQRGIQLLRPPSVASGAKLSKEEARQTKEVASLRIHIERVIRRVREFSMLKPHSVINSNLIRVLDEVILIACALVNLQDSLIK